MGNQIVENKKGVIRISVRNLVEFILREGDIDNRRGRISSTDAMQEGSRIHRKIQKSMGPEYHAEVPLRITIEEEDYQLVIEGRADGILIEPREDDQGTGKRTTFADNYNRIAVGDGMRVMIDEIKGMYMKTELLQEPIGVHRAQAMCYAYIYALQHDLEEIDVQMTYCNLDSMEMKYFREHFTFEALEKWFAKLIAEYKKWADFQFAWRMLRQESIRKLEFPFAYRRGQHDLAAGVYRTIARRKNLFIQAPTGVGKTISTIFPAVKATGEELGDKIFYLTAKTITGTVAREAFELLRGKGYQAKVLQITAKEKLCMCEEMDCNPVHCPYAKGHYDRVNDAVFSLLQKEDVFTREVISEQAREYQVCPFELCLDVATWVDDIICDYNYVFDPNAYLKRFFAEGVRGDYIFLVDEAHNLVERSREMYSAVICKEDFLSVKRRIKQYDAKLAKDFDRCNKILLEYKRECERYVVYDDIGSLILPLTRLFENLDEFLQKKTEFPERREVSEFFLQLRDFRNTYELVDDHYVIYTEHGEDGKFRMKLFCVDPSRNLQERLDKGKATIFFSATLLPVGYYKSLLSTKTDNYAIYAETAFTKEQSRLFIGGDVSSRYTRRTPEEFARIARYVLLTAQAKKGNYMVFFPSYKMLQQVYEVFCEMNRGEEGEPAASAGMRDQSEEDISASAGRDNQSEEDTAASVRSDNQSEEDISASAGRDNQSEEDTAASVCETVSRKAGIAERTERSLDKRSEVSKEKESRTGAGEDAQTCSQGLVECMVQQSGMTEAEREEFLMAFSEEESSKRDRSFVAFCVLGGIFGEGIDLKHEQLIGAVIVGPGLPQVGNEREILMKYYDRRSGEGFDYAYRYPGMNKVLQAAGRVIRTVEDTGVILLLDERFLQRDYQRLFPREWERRLAVRIGTAEEKIKAFWEEH